MSEVKHTPLLPCPFCGGDAERITIEEEGDNFGGDVIQCMGVCGASSHVEFGRKENLVSLWNTRVNSHGDLVEALRECLTIIPEPFDDWDGSERAQIYRRATAALSKVLELGEGL